jgi:hypothetical protein
MQQPGWKQAETLLASLAQGYYPNPKDEKYNNWEVIAVDYTFARGATEVVKQFLEIMHQQEDILRHLLEKRDRDNVQNGRIGQ